MTNVTIFITLENAAYVCCNMAKEYYVSARKNAAIKKDYHEK